MPKKSNNPAGRKPKVVDWMDDDKLSQIEEWRSKGLSIAQVAQNMGIADSTLRLWQKKYSEISAALNRGSTKAQLLVENALFMLATGQAVDKSTTIYTDKNGNFNGQQETTKEKAPELGAITLYLKNTRPDLWQDKQQLEVSGQVANNPVGDLSTDDLKDLINGLKQVTGGDADAD